MLIGAHMSAAGGFHKAVERAAGVGFNTVQLFVQQPRQWAVKDNSAAAVMVGGDAEDFVRVAKPIADSDVERFDAAVKAAGVEKPCAHASYLINLASPNSELWAKSVMAFAIELQRAEQLGLAGIVIHPGTATGIGEQAGLDNVIRALNVALESSRTERVEIWLETTAGQGASLGHRFEHFAELIGGVDRRERFGICLDTCHVFAAGYGLVEPEEFAETVTAFDRIVGLDRLRAFHLNDSKKPRGSRVDRHEHIGDGCLGLEPFRHLLNDPRLAGRPMYFETPKGLRDGCDFDAVNLGRLRDLVRPTAASANPRRRQDR